MLKEEGDSSFRSSYGRRGCIGLGNVSTVRVYSGYVVLLRCKIDMESSAQQIANLISRAHHDWIEFIAEGDLAATH